MVSVYSRCSIMQELRGSCLTMSAHLHTLVCRDKSLGSDIKKAEGRDVSGREMTETHLACFPATWQHREAGSGLSTRICATRDMGNSAILCCYGSGCMSSIPKLQAIK